jgi:pre-rRNA-processing protein TSR1
MDAVAVSLYKRVWPRPARAWNAEEDVGAVQSEDVDVDAPMVVE